jgi:NAD(P)H-dependent FMN reductase
MHLGVIVGSHRQQSQSTRVAAYIAQQLARLEPTLSVDTIDLAGNPLPLWDESIWQGDTPLLAQWKPFRDRLRKADGFVVISPEWGGMVPPGLKNLLLLASPKEVGHKPALIVAVSASRGGSYPVTELRTTGYKNNRLLFIPEQVIVHDVSKVLAGDTASDDRDAWLRKRIEFALKLLLSYTQAMASVRSSGLTEHPDFPYGM